MSTDGIRVLGIDPGTLVVGYGVLDIMGPGRYRYVECGVLEAPKEASVDARVLELSTSLVEIVEELRPVHVAIETAFHGLNASSALKLAEARGAYKLVVAQLGLEPAEYPPATVKRAVVGNGRATKAEVQARVRLLCNLERPPAVDAADGLAIAICHAQAARLMPSAVFAGAR